MKWRPTSFKTVSLTALAAILLSCALFPSVCAEAAISANSDSGALNTAASGGSDTFTGSLSVPINGPFSAASIDTTIPSAAVGRSTGNDHSGTNGDHSVVNDDHRVTNKDLLTTDGAGENQRSAERRGGGRSAAETRAEERQRSDGALTNNATYRHSLPIPSAVQFKVALRTPIDSRKAFEGQIIRAALKDDLVYEGRIVAEAGTELIGHVEHLRKSRRMLKAMVSNDGRFTKSGSMTIIFDEMVTPHSEHFNIVGIISRQHTTQESGRYPRELKVGKHGDIQKAEEVFSTGDQMISQVLNFAISSGLGPLGTVASFGAAPIVLGALGAIEPETAYLKPVSEDDKHPRIKGFALGATSSLPGYQAIEVFGFKGDDLKLRVGDEFMVQAHAPYNDIVAADGALIPRDTFDSMSVKATVVPKSAAVREKIHY